MTTIAPGRPNTTKLPNFDALLKFLQDAEKHGGLSRKGIAKLGEWARLMRAWGTAIHEERDKLREVNESLERALMESALHEEIIDALADVRRGIRTLDEVLEMVP
jgi:hypothetical protein